MSHKKYAIGVDMGGTYTKFGLVDDQGTITRAQQIRTDSYRSPEDFVAALSLHLQSIVDYHDQDHTITGIGIGAPNANYHTGTIDRAANLPWRTYIPLRDMVASAMNIKTVITNDAKAAALGEMQFGVAKGMKDFIVVTLGTGIGSGIVSNGQLIYGHDGMAGEVGHIIAKPNGRPCGCGRKGCLETYASATGILNTAQKIMLANNLVPFENSQAITDAAMMGNPMALEIFNQTGKVLGKVLAHVHTVISPEAIIFFGGLANARDYLLVPTQKAFEEELLFVYKERKPQFLISALQHRNAAILGAAALVF
ncbi:glucokinase [Taibaiella sp. KBW10]|uniref:ROK family protein n=1 Tax=Taibaiella sp. KBW10 TaxID=2153357 RepID=UPI000F5AF7A0|nr:ROK family protein [Taibaiella sp. KBW10]RQO32481.1 glucokinase [Taibaiella sp. KBW10]